MAARKPQGLLVGPRDWIEQQRPGFDLAGLETTGVPGLAEACAALDAAAYETLSFEPGVLREEPRDALLARLPPTCISVAFRLHRVPGLEVGAAGRLPGYREPYRLGGLADLESMLADEPPPLMVSLMPSLSYALRAVQYTERVRSAFVVVESLAGMMPGGVALTSTSGNVYTASNSLARLLASRDGLTMSDGRIVATERAARQRIEQALRAADSPEGPEQLQPTLLSLPRSGLLRPLQTILQPIVIEPGGEGLGRTVVVAWIVRDIEAPISPSARLLAELHGLTPAESKLAIEIANGLSVAEAAEALGITVNSARTRLKSVFAKLGVSRQGELVRVLHTGVSPIGSDAQPEGDAAG